MKLELVTNLIYPRRLGDHKPGPQASTVFRAKIWIDLSARRRRGVSGDLQNDFSWGCNFVDGVWPIWDELCVRNDMTSPHHRRGSVIYIISNINMSSWDEVWCFRVSRCVLPSSDCTLVPGHWFTLAFCVSCTLREVWMPGVWMLVAIEFVFAPPPAEASEIVHQDAL